MLQIIIFSYNRALQIDTLICSLKEHWKMPAYHVSVLYNTSNDFYEQGYSIVKEKYRDVVFIKENNTSHKILYSDFLNFRNLIHFVKYSYLIRPKSDFRRKLIQMMEQSDSRHIMFMTDDAMFIRDVQVSQSVLDWILTSPYQNEYSLRLGNGVNEEPENIKRTDYGYEWNTYEVPQDNNWGYQFSVDAHIYSKELILKLFKTYVFANPNTMEGYICEQVRRRHWISNCKCPHEITLLSYPINMVQTVGINETLGVSTEKMNKYYLEGYSMKYPIPKNIVYFQQYPNFIYLNKEDDHIKLSLNDIKN